MTKTETVRKAVDARQLPVASKKSSSERAALPLKAKKHLQQKEKMQGPQTRKRKRLPMKKTRKKMKSARRLNRTLSTTKTRPRKSKRRKAKNRTGNGFSGLEASLREVLKVLPGQNGSNTQS